MKKALDKIKLYGTVNGQGGVRFVYFLSLSSQQYMTFPRAATNT